MRELGGKVAVVTGAASGIGFGLAERFTAEGMKVVMADIEEGALDDAAGRLAAAGADVLPVVADVSDPDSVAELAARAFERYETAHVLCNNAGVSGGGGRPVWELDERDWDWVLGVNLKGVIHGVRAFMPRMIEQGEGHVVNTASMAGLLPGVLGSYSVSKHGVVALSEAIYFSLLMRGVEGVGVSVLCPGWVRTNIADAHRNRPDRFGPEPELPADAAVLEGVVRGLIDAGLEPADVAGMVAEAVRENRFYVITHPDYMAGVEARVQAMIAGGPPSAASLF